jgi:UDP-glucose 4-epimerase
MDKWIVITGGSGYIGSHLASVIKEKTDYKVMIIDRRAKYLTHTLQYSDCYIAEDFASDIALEAIRGCNPEYIVHCAANSTISSGVVDPFGMYDNNVSKTIKLVETATNLNLTNFIFISTSAVYADVDYAVNEASLTAPSNAYASSKFTIEHLLRDCVYSYRFSSTSLRLFNVSGAHPYFDLGELYGSSHLISRIMESAVDNRPLEIYGNDWNTPDGTPIRDYIHVLDVVDAILKLINRPFSPDCAEIYNIGSGSGYSVKSIIDTTENLLGKKLNYTYGHRREGDSEKRFSDYEKINTMVGWKPTRNLHDIIKDAWKWYNSENFKRLTKLRIWCE